MNKHPPGTVRDAIVTCLRRMSGDASVSEIRDAVERKLGGVPASSVLFAAAPGQTHRSGPLPPQTRIAMDAVSPAPMIATARRGREDCEAASRLQRRRHGSALVEYSEREQRKLHGGRGGVWRLPPSFDGHRRSPLPRFTTLTAEDLDNLHGFFREFGVLLERLLVPGAHVFVASNPLVSYVAAAAAALAEAGLENRSVVTRLVMTMRGGDRPKNAHEEFSGSR